jgi:hypothetical protein
MGSKGADGREPVDFGDQLTLTLAVHQRLHKREPVLGKNSIRRNFEILSLCNIVTSFQRQIR